MSANFMTKQHAAGLALAAKRGQVRSSELEGPAKSLHDNLTEGELEEVAKAKFYQPQRVKEDEKRAS